MNGLVLSFAMSALLIGGVWIAVFGQSAAMLSEARGGSRARGFVLGAALGPIGWGVILYEASEAGRQATEALGDGMGAVRGELTDAVAALQDAPTGLHGSRGSSDPGRHPRRRIDP